MPKTVAIIQARLGSTRLPGKVLKEIIGLPMIDHVVERTSRARLIDEVVIATSDSPTDTRLFKYSNLKNWPIFCGSENDVLERYWKCAKEHQADYIVRITSDCPMISPQIIDQVIEKQLSTPQLDYACNFHPDRTFPRGLDVECLAFDTLDRVYHAATKPELREHVTLMIYRQSDLFQLGGIQCSSDLSSWRWTVDTEADLRLVRTVFHHFGDNKFTWQQAVRAFQDHPEWHAINQHVMQKAA